MKLFAKLATIFAAVTISYSVSAAELRYVDAQTLTHLGKMFKTENPYHRVETSAYPDLTPKEAELLRYPSGEAILFETNSAELWVRMKIGRKSPMNGMPNYATLGFTLYIENEQGEWQWAASHSGSDGIGSDGKERLERPLALVKNMDGTQHKCLLYLPLYLEITDLKIGVVEDSDIRAVESPFRHKIAVFGSSFTQGHGATNSGQTYLGFLQRWTGLDFISFGMGGNSKLQPVMARILAATNADAFVFDAFSNPSIQEIKERIHPFIRTIQASHPGKPLIFLRTIYRENRTFDTVREKREQDRMEYVDALMAEVVAQYDDVYFIAVQNQTGTDHETSADGTHPMSWGYYRWAKAIEKPLLKHLKKYDIR